MNIWCYPRFFMWEIFQSMFASNSEKLSLYEEIIRPRHDDKILDIGCSNGLMSGIFTECKYYGVDMDRDAVTFAKNRYKRYPNMHFCCGDITKMSFPVRFDHVLLACIGHHLGDEELKEILECVAEFLNDDGDIIFIDMINKDHYPLRTRFVLWMERGKYIRTLGAHDKMFGELPRYRVDARVVKKFKKKPIPQQDFACFTLKLQDGSK